ncbi:hypothetical protein BDV27DRAFT_119350 [Aspergillus caelatus]|uniref:Uncharacterized protein n=1 Tax=Aspergillus caelatus TaxID=61420 RepID=A0A5N7ALI9_9EURO|nr:uncharacterized protein BDV27DRAFT_119350 [Aspergillus caelatus]KAE8370701.1 hypothetical protein BDV27DRAFT_119350 [Aspergillus caelatus]
MQVRQKNPLPVGNAICFILSHAARGPKEFLCAVWIHIFRVSLFLGPHFLYHLLPVLIPIKLDYPSASDSLRSLEQGKDPLGGSALFAVIGFSSLIFPKRHRSPKEFIAP